MCDSLNNFRVLGGPLFYQLDDHKEKNPLGLSVYRSARPDHITNEDLLLLQRKYGVRYFLDLRNYKDEYLAEDGLKLLDQSSFTRLKVLHIDTVEKNNLQEGVWLKNGSRRCHALEKNGNDNIMHHYLVNLFGYSYVIYWLKDNNFSLWKSIINSCGTGLRCALQLINQHGNTPFVVCCHAGKDRTGIMSAILLSVCGFDKQLIAQDYETSQLGLKFSKQEMKDFGEEMKGAPKEVMLELLDYIDKEFGSMSEYLVSIGFSIEEQKQLKENLIERDDFSENF